MILSPWFRFFLSHDPRPVLMKVKCPLLAINGEKDLQVPADENLKAIAAALKDGGNADFTVKKLPGLNHLFQTAAERVAERVYEDRGDDRPGGPAADRRLDPGALRRQIGRASARKGLMNQTPTPGIEKGRGQAPPLHLELGLMYLDH